MKDPMNELERAFAGALRGPEAAPELYRQLRESVVSFREMMPFFLFRLPRIALSVCLSPSILGYAQTRFGPTTLLGGGPQQQQPYGQNTNQ